MKLSEIDLRARYDELQGLDWKNPGAWSQWVYYFFCVLAFVVILVGGYYYFIAPSYANLKQAQRKETRLRHQFEFKQHRVAALGAYKKQLAEMKKNFGAMLKQLPSKSEVANLLNDISQARIAAGLDEELFQPQAQRKKDFYAVIPNKIIVTGHYHQMGNFVSAVAALPRIVTIDQVSIVPLKGKGHKGELRMSALAKTYRYLGESESSARHKHHGRRR